MRAAAAALIVAAALLPGCRRAGDAGAPQRAADSAPASAAPAAPQTPATAAADGTVDLTGIWTVVGHRIPGISGMSDAEAATWHGRTVRLAEGEALGEGNHCDRPEYVARSAARDSLLAADFRLPAGALPELTRPRVTLLEVRCGGARWAAMGSRLIAADAGRALAPWDGVFFELARDRDFQAIGQEPGWKLDIIKGKQIVFAYAYGERTATVPAPTPETDSTGARTYRAVTEASDLRVTIEPRPCTDAMSGNPFETTVTVTLNEETYRGCGGPM